MNLLFSSCTLHPKMDRSRCTKEYERRFNTAQRNLDFENQILKNIFFLLIFKPYNYFLFVCSVVEGYQLFKSYVTKNCFKIYFKKFLIK